MNIGLENSINKIVKNSNKYRNELGFKVEEKIKWLKDILIEIHAIIEELKSKAKLYDVKFLPDMNLADKISNWIQNLQIMKEKLDSITITENNIFDDEEYLLKAQEILDILSKINFKEEIEKIKEENSNKVDTAINEKKENQIELANLETELREDKLSYKQIAEKLNVSTKKVDNRLRVLKGRFKRKYNDENDDDKTQY